MFLHTCLSFKERPYFELVIFAFAQHVCQPGKSKKQRDSTCLFCQLYSLNSYEIDRTKARKIDYLYYVKLFDLQAGPFLVAPSNKKLSILSVISLCLLQSKQTHTGAVLSRFQGLGDTVREVIYPPCARTTGILDCK